MSYFSPQKIVFFVTPIVPQIRECFKLFAPNHVCTDFLAEGLITPLAMLAPLSRLRNAKDLVSSLRRKAEGYFGFATRLGQRGSDNTLCCHSLPRSFKSFFVQSVPNKKRHATAYRFLFGAGKRT
jgi:hypothetical protein